MTPIEKEIEGIVDGILEDYRHGRDIDKLDPFQHPDKAVVIDMIGKPRLLPGQSLPHLQHQAQPLHAH